MEIKSNIKRGKYKMYSEEEKKAELKKLNNERARKWRARQKEIKEQAKQKAQPMEPIE